MMSQGFTHEEALRLWNSLIEAKFDCLLGYSHYPKMVPSENFSVTVNVGPGQMVTAERLAQLIAIAERHDAGCHLLGQGISIFKNNG